MNYVVPSALYNVLENTVHYGMNKHVLLMISKQYYQIASQNSNSVTTPSESLITKLYYDMFLIAYQSLV